MIVTNHQPKLHRRAAFTLLEVLVVVAIIVILAGGASIYVFGYLDRAREDNAQTQIGMLESACKSFQMRNNGQPPSQLQELLSPTNGGQPYIEGGPNALNDPWGKPYQYSVQTDNYGNLDAQVTTTTNDGRLIRSARRNSTGQ